MTKISDDVVERLWRDLCEKSDRTSPAEYPDMALITLDELRAAGEVFVAWERERANDKIDGLQSDLDSAVEIAWKYGAHEWVKLNYPNFRARSAPEKE